jgi:hypothetical protein
MTDSKNALSQTSTERDLEFENWFADYISDSGVAPEHDIFKQCWDAGKEAGRNEATQNLVWEDADHVGL